MSMVMVFTMSLCVFAETDSTALEITNLVGTKKNLYVTLSENVSVTAENNPTATVTQYGADNTVYTATVTAQDNSQSANKLEIAVSPALPIDGNFKLTLSADGKTAEQSFGYQTLLKETFDSESSAQNTISDGGQGKKYEISDGKYKRVDAQWYPLVTKKSTVTEDWHDYTVEFEYYDTLSPVGEDVTPQYWFIAFFYNNQEIWSIAPWGLQNGVVSVSKFINNTEHAQHMLWYQTTDGTNVKKEAPLYVGETAKDMGNDVIYSASLFGNKAYNSLTKIGEDTPFYTGEDVINDGDTVNTYGGFDIQVTKQNGNMNYDSYIDNLIAYKLKTFNIDYSENTTFKYYGSKSKLIFDFDANVVNADVTLKDYKTGNEITAVSAYDATAQKLIVTPASDLSVDGVYSIDIIYGIGKEVTKSMLFGYNVLYEDDFSNEAKTKTFFNLGGNRTILDGKLAAIYDVYQPIYVNDNIAKDWSDYTVEYDFYENASHTKEDGTAYDWSGDASYNPSLSTLFYVPENKFESNSGTNFAVMASTWNFDNGRLSYIKDNNRNIVLSGDTEVINGIKNHDIVRYSASLLNKTAILSVKDQNGALLYGFTQSVPYLERTSGKFALNAFAANSYNSGPRAYYDNLLVYKMKEVFVDYSDNESITAYGSKNKLMFKFDKDLHDAEVVLKDAQGNTVNVTSSYDASKKAVFAAPESELDINKTYTATVKYGLVKEFSKDITFGFEVLYSDSFDDITKTEGYLKNIGNEDTAKKYEITADGKLHIGDRMYMPAYMKKGMADDSEVWKDYTVEYDWFDTISHQQEDGKTDWAWGEDTSYTPSLSTLFYVDDEKEAGEWRGWIDFADGTSGYGKYFFGAQVGTWIYADSNSQASVQYVTQGKDREILNSAAPTSARGDYNAVKGKEQVKFSASMFGNTAVTTVKDGNTELFGYELDVPHLKNTSGKFAINSFAAHAYLDGPTAYIDNLLVYKMAVIGDGKLDIRYASFEKANNAVTVSGLNITDITEGFGLALAVYGENGTLLGVNFADTNSESISVENIDTTKITDVKLMFWSKSNALKPVRGMMDLY